MLAIILLLLTTFTFAEFKPLDARLSSYQYPFPVSFFEVPVKDKSYEMAYMDVKPEGKVKGTVVLLHGKNFSGHYWERTAKDFSKKGYRVIIPDQIGFGKSSKPESFPYSFHLLGKFTQDLLKQLKVKNYYLIGHSMGGMLATRMALMYPENVKKLLLVNPIGLEDWKTEVPYKTVNELYQAELKSSEDKIREYQKKNYYDGKWKAEYEKGIEVLVGWTMHKDHPVIAWNSALTSDMIMTQPVVYEFKNLSMPTLLLLGTRDRTAVGKGWASPAVQRKLGRYDQLGRKVIKDISRGKLVELKGIGHMPQVESYDSYWQNILAFIEK